MTLSAHTINPKTGSKKKSKRVGRGNASGKGTYSARGLKGQRSRSGGKSGGKLRGFRQSLQKVPKLRGFKSHRPSAQTVTLKTLSSVIEEGVEVTPFFLKEKKVIRQSNLPVKIVATGELKGKVVLRGCLASKKAVELIEKAGGKIVF